MPDLSLPRVAAMAVCAGALLWPVAGGRIETWLTPDTSGCAHSSDLPAPANLQESRAAILCLLNQERRRAGLPVLVEDTRLRRSAQGHAEDMGRRDFYAHDNPDGASPDMRIRAAGYDGRATGENIHWGVDARATPQRIMQDWMRSPGHRANILRRAFRRVGVGVAHEAPKALEGGIVGVYVQNFGR